eukprot:SAG22_NODE_535_length_9385_cov_6.941202_5_plen_131_part_00
MPTEEDRAAFLREGYLIIRGVISPDELPELRGQCEVMVGRQQALWEAAAAGDAVANVSTVPRRGTVRTGTVAADGAQPRLFISYPPLCARLAWVAQGLLAEQRGASAGTGGEHARERSDLRAAQSSAVRR